MLVNCMYYYVFFIDWLNKETETETEVIYEFSICLLYTTIIIAQ